MAPPPPPPPPPPPVPEIGFDAILDGLSNGAQEGNQSAGLPSFASESNGMDAMSQLAVVEAPQKKPWEKPLTIPEIRKSSQNWSLASDAGLLLYLQEFSQKMMSKTSDLEKRMDSLVHDAKSADSRVHNTFNDFLMLANTQFIENRVYDDSEDVDGGSQSEKDKKEQATKTREQREAEVIPRVIKALTLGINVLDTGFEHLDANAGNSDSEDEDPTYKAVDPILEAKDMYGHRSLPYIIGTPAFMQDDDVGLMDVSEEEVEDDSSVETLSDSEKSELSDSEYSDTETESEFTGGRQKMTADTTMASTNRSESEDSDTGLFDDEEPSDQEAAAQPVNFQDELSAKLGGGMTRGAPNQEPVEVTDESNRNRSISEDSKTSSQESSKKGTRRKKLPLDREKKSKKKRSTSKAEDDNLFGEQPGQGEGEVDDSPFGKKGLFSSSGGGLFDDDKEEDGGLFDDKPSAAGRRDVTSDHVYEDIVTNPEEVVKPGRKAPPGGVPLFGAGVATEDELFGGSPKLSQEGPEDAIAQDIGQKEASKPDSSSSGGLFGSQGDDRLFSEPSKPAPKKEAGKPKTKKQVDLFGGEDASDLFGGENKPKQPPKKKIPAGAVNVFGNAGPVGGQTEPPPLDDGGDEGMYVNTMVGAAGAGRSKQAGLGGGGLFDNVDEDLFGAPPPRPADKPTAKNDSDKLFADDEDDNDLFAAPPPLPKDESKAAAKKNQGLFDDIEGEGEEDFFTASSKPKEQPKKKPPGGVALFEGADIFGSPPKIEVEPPQQQKPDQLSPQAKANRTQNTLSLFHDDDDKDEDLFATPPALPPKKEQLDPNPSKEEQMARRRTKSKSIFDDEAILFGLKNEENPGVDLFGSNTPVPQTKNQSESEKDEKSGSARKRATSESKGLFGDADEGEDDLFASTGSKTTPRPTGVKAAVASKKEKKKKSATLPAAKGGLFDDDDGDDLFGESKPKKKEKKKEEKKKEEKEEKKDAEKKVNEERSSVVDPLGGVGLSSEGGGGATAPEPPKQDPPSLSTKKPSKKPPAGAVSMFGGMDPSSLIKKKKKEAVVVDDPFDDDKANLNIDPTALRPGAAPPERVVESSGVGFDQPAVAKTLDVNPTKTRARVSAKRRPPSRRSLQAAAASASNPALWGDDSKQPDDGFRTFTQNLATDEPDHGASASAAAAPAPPPAKKPASRTLEDHMDGPQPPPSAGAKPKKPTPSNDLFNDDLFSSASSNGSSKEPSQKTVSKTKEERPFSIEGDSELFAAAATTKKQPSRTHDTGDSLFTKPPQVNLDASLDDIFATPPVLGHSSKQSSMEVDPVYEDIFASGTNTKSKRSTLTDLAIDEDLFGDIGKTKPKDTSSVSIDADLFGGPPPVSTTPTTTTTTKPKKKKAVKKAQVLEDDDDLFAAKPKKTKAKAAKATDADLFGSSDIFADLPPTKPKEKKKKTTAPAQEAIFKDVGGDDIFAEPSPSSKPKKTKAKKKTTKEASDSIFDTDAPNIFDDPLNAINT